MAKRTAYGKLHIWMNGELVGLWEQTQEALYGSILRMVTKRAGSPFIAIVAVHAG
jgi:hypothetical protein